MIWVVGYNFGLLGWLLGICDPPYKFFHPHAAGNCKYSGVWKELSAWSAMNVFTDFLIFFLPLPMILRLQMPMAQKIGVILTLGTGLMVCAATIVNLVISVKIIRQESTEDPLQLWAIIEMNVGLLVICLPAMKQLLSRSVPQLSYRFGSYGSSGKRKSSKGQASGDRTPGGRSRSWVRQGKYDTDTGSLSDERLTHELKQLAAQHEVMPESRGNGDLGHGTEKDPELGTNT